MDQRARFLDLVQRNLMNAAILDRGPALGVPDWWLTAGAVFQTVWNVLDGRDPGAGIADYDFFYYDASDLSYEAEDAVIRKAAALFADLGVTVEVRNEARVHLWYEARFGVQGVRFTSSADAIDHFASTTCCFGVSRTPIGELVDYAPHGYADLFAMRVRPNPLLAPRAVYEAKARRWQREWPGLVVDPWPDSAGVAE
ncbi:nucleotidyltransferase family protein [Pseudonocardia sp. CA-142604]|uniref:nucleotidyltransferase family protein n=1 Tax=Pseudonocardia sp. CA-142604 TaxID=3240024 RepID=UPI003D8DF872